MKIITIKLRKHGSIWWECLKFQREKRSKQDSYLGRMKSSARSTSKKDIFKKPFSTATIHSRSTIYGINRAI